MLRSLSFLVASALLFGGCSISRSISESSGSLISSSLSISSSAAIAGDDAYASDLSAATVAFVEAGPVEADPFLREVGRIAGEHGITDWEQRPETYHAIGMGLQQGRLDEQSTRSLATRICEGRPQAGAQILAGYREAAAP